MDHDFDQKCSDAYIIKIARIVNKWEDFACYFGLSKPEITEIERDHHNDYGQQKIEFLYRWRRKNGDQATIKKLRSCLKEAKEDELMQSIDQELGMLCVGVHASLDTPTNHHTTAMVSKVMRS